MADIISREQRSRNMAAIKAKNTAPEMQVRKFLHSKGFRYRLHRKDFPGKPDLVLKRYNTVIFVHGCFWHQHENCRYSVMPKSNTEFWEKKLSGNVRRDRANILNLKSKNWRVIVIWECELKDESFLNRLVDKIKIS